MTTECTLVRDGTMLLTDELGEVSPTGGTAHGLYLDDVRHLSDWRLTVDAPGLVLMGSTGGADHRSIALGQQTARNEPSEFVLIREQEVGRDGLHERWHITRTGAGTSDLVIRLRASADFVDQFQVRSDGRTFGTRTVRTAQPLESGVDLEGTVSHSGDTIPHRTRVRATPAPQVGCHANHATLEWTLHLVPGATSTIEIAALARDAAAPAPAAPASGRAARALTDLDALAMPCPGAEHLRIPAAGAPWFLTLFGRDSLLTSLLAGPERPALLPDVVRALTATQAEVEDPARVAAPGKIVHELRVGDLARLGLVPYGRYYGTVDATPLFLMALGSLPAEVVAAPEISSAARRAVGWMCGPGGLDGDGFLTYRPDPDGLINQGWKDSVDAVAFGDGRLATGPIALCEVQGYAWRGLVEAARLARTAWNDPEWAHELDELAEQLRTRLIDRFWMPAEGFPALALDGDGAQVDALASNAGHLLWCGVLDDDRAAAVADRLMAPEFFTGFGFRTLAAGQARYSPTSYHNGSVWPHDTMLAALGMHEAGLVDQATTVSAGILDAADAFEGRLPELFGGFSRSEFAVPVRCPRAGTPQAWAAAATIAAARLVSTS